MGRFDETLDICAKLLELIYHDYSSFFDSHGFDKTITDDDLNISPTPASFFPERSSSVSTPDVAKPKYKNTEKTKGEFPSIAEQLKRNKIEDDLRGDIRSALDTFQNQFGEHNKVDRLNVDYVSDSAAIAYMLYYFPKYIKPIYQLLQSTILQNTKLEYNFLKRENVNILAFGAGAAPEVLGVLGFINKHENCIEKINAYLYD